MGLHLPEESRLQPKSFLIYNIVILVLIPFISVFMTAGTYIVGLVLGIILAIAIVIVLFIYAGPIIAVIVLLLFALLLGGGSAAVNAVGNSIETIAAFISMSIPAILCLILGVAMIKNAQGFEEKRTRTFAYITAIAYGVAIILFIVSAVQMVSDGENGIGDTSFYRFGMLIPSIARLFYTIFGYKELKNN